MPNAAADGADIIDHRNDADGVRRQLVLHLQETMPHVELEQAGHYAMAKIKEAVLAVTGG